jgi:hypothetical protein
MYLRSVAFGKSDMRTNRSRDMRLVGKTPFPRWWASEKMVTYISAYGTIALETCVDLLSADFKMSLLDSFVTTYIA